MTSNDHVTVPSQSTDAYFAVASASTGQLAWFLVEEDAEDFIAAQARPERYMAAGTQVEPVSRGVVMLTTQSATKATIHKYGNTYNVEIRSALIEPTATQESVTVNLEAEFPSYHKAFEFASQFDRLPTLSEFVLE